MVATSSADPKQTASATILVVAPKPGVWTQVTPAGLTLDPNFHGTLQNYGVMDAVADPARKSDLYAFACYQGVWRSQDFGLTWTKVSTGTNGAILETGRPWTAAIDNNPLRDPNTPPALYTANGYEDAAGVYKSVDWGVNWTRYDADKDVYSFDMDPYDNQHLITGMHEADGLQESIDGGLTWTDISTGNTGHSIYPHFIDTGKAETTRKTWLLVPQIDTGTSVMTFDEGKTLVPVAMVGSLILTVEIRRSMRVPALRMWARAAESGKRRTEV